MTYGGIDRRRFTYLLSLGVDEFELKKFFTECRAPLIQHGGKVQNLPQGKNARIRTLAVELPPATDDVVRAWFAKHVTMVDPEEAEAVVGVFKRYEELDEALPEDSARRYSRSCLVHLFGKSPAQSLLDFLKSPIGGPIGEQKNANDIEVTLWQAPQIGAYPENLPQVLIDLVSGKDADEHLEGLPPALATFISGLQAGAQGQAENTRDAIEALSSDPQLRDRLEVFFKQSEAKAASKELSPRGLRIATLKEHEGLFDFDRDEILGYCTKADSPNAVFVQPLAVVRSGEIQLLELISKILAHENCEAT